ncbi:MAG: response regulator transcription factor [Chitinophagaceae bacterium]|nr:response regulator transcription factor [Chitinophagaceae bacterium]MBP6590511.1 response regulator transcription factor [Chitinophagaceae bacterium]
MIQVAIVEDIREIKEGLELLIDSSEGFRCIKTYSNAEEAMEDLPLINPDVVLMDINLPGINGIEAVRSLKPKIPATQFIMSTVYEDDENIFESLKAGASGYLLKKTAPSKILESITEVFNGGSPMSSQIARKVIGSFQQKNSIEDSSLLTQREKEILKLLARGLRYKEIATELTISIDTVRTHTRHIYEKLQVQSRIEAINKVMGK